MRKIDFSIPSKNCYSDFQLFGTKGLLFDYGTYSLSRDLLKDLSSLSLIGLSGYGVYRFGAAGYKSFKSAFNELKLKEPALKCAEEKSVEHKSMFFSKV